jgi:hypothetical protein
MVITKLATLVAHAFDVVGQAHGFAVSTRRQFNIVGLTKILDRFRDQAKARKEDNEWREAFNCRKTAALRASVRRTSTRVS